MTSLATLSGTLVAIFQSSTLCKQVRVVETKAFSSDQFFLKIRAELPEDARFQVRVYYNQGHTDYAYQLFTDVPLLRWDNKEEFPYLETYPHHPHDEQGNIKSSPLQGDPLKDIEVVLAEISLFLSGRSKSLPNNG